LTTPNGSCVVASAAPRNDQAKPDSPWRSLQGEKWSEDIAAWNPAASAWRTAASSSPGGICSWEQCMPIRGIRAVLPNRAGGLPCPAVVDESIFKAYDVRGTHPEQMDEALAYRLGRGFARVLSDLQDTPVGDLRVGVGRDMRLTAPAMTEQYVRGIADEGADVLDVGMVGTEMLYWTVGSRELDGGLMCTASHNPKAYTGAKLVKRGALALSGDSGIGELRDIVTAGEPGDPAPDRGEVAQEDVGDAFREAALGYVDASKIRPLKVVLDGGNGMAGPMVGPLLDTFPIKQVRTYWEPNGELPDHEPNPLLEENRRFIIDKVRETGADLGIAWDGDADRCFFIDDTGEFVAGDFLTALLAEALLRKEPGATVLYDVRASRAVPELVAEHGGRAEVNRVGHAFFKTRMRDTGAAFGGEVSGHYYFRDFYCADSGTIPALLILELLSEEDRKLSELLAPLRSRYFISGEINSEVEDQEGKMDEIRSRYSDGEVGELDGVSVDYDDWHFNVRPSNTEPLLRLNLESVVSQEHMAEKRDEVLALMRA
jgi:phosphomannomutase